jgi:cell wall-associated NlpC family hydrolase
MQFSFVLSQRVDGKITRGFECVDARATNIANRAHSRRIKTANLTVRATARIDQRIETDFLRADARVNAGINHTVNAIETTLARAASTTNAADTRISNAVTRVDTRIDRRKQQSLALGASTVNHVSTKAAALEQSLETGISRIDARVSNGHVRVLATATAALDVINIIDSGLTSAVTHTDGRIDRRVQQLNRTYSYVSDAAMSQFLATDLKLDTSVATFDRRVATGVTGLMLVARNITHFVSDQVDDTDTALTHKLSQVDGRVDSLIDLINGQPGRHASQPRASLPWAATSLTLVLGTLGAATGASVVNANTVKIEVDSTVKIEASAAKDAVTQYLSVRDSFQALQASRTRTIQSLEQEIAAAEARLTKTGLSGKAIIDVADNYGGVPYVRGGTTPKGFDCSGYTKHVFAQLGVTLPRVSAQQYAWADRVSFDDRKVGDLMFWSNGGGVHHVAIYAGDGKMWDSPRPGRRVGKSTIWGNPTYGRVPTEVINASALAEIATKKAELKKIKATEPKLEITVHPNFVSPSSD